MTDQERHITSQGEQPLFADKLTPSEFLEARRDIADALEAETMSEDEAAAALSELSSANPAMQATWEADIQRPM